MGLTDGMISENEDDSIPIEGVVILPEDPVDTGPTDVLDLPTSVDLSSAPEEELSSDLFEEIVDDSFESLLSHGFGVRDEDTLSVSSAQGEAGDSAVSAKTPPKREVLRIHYQKIDKVKTFGEIVSESGRLFKGIEIALLVLMIIGSFYVFRTSSLFNAGCFGLILVATFFVVFSWNRRRLKGLPILPAIALQQCIIYSIPFILQDEQFMLTSSRVISASIFSICLFLGSLWSGWRVGLGLIRRPPISRYHLILMDVNHRDQRSAILGISFLVFAVFWQFLTRTGIIFELLSGDASRLFPVFRTLADAVSILGAIIGGMVLGMRGRFWVRCSYVVLILVSLLLTLVDFRLMAASTLMIAVATGLTMVKKRVPWIYLIMAFLFLGFLNQSKFTMRDRYWDDGATWVEKSFSEYPALYREWFQASWKILTTQDGGVREAILAKNSTSGSGQSILDRVDNLSNLNFVISAIEEKGIGLLYGETYTMVPKLLIPRFLWKDKPRTHEGQVVLNLHFERQQSREDTEVTYVAWGVLPEAVGNFGPFFGPLWVGLILGLCLGMLERISIRQHLFSVEGLLLMGTLVKIGTSHEMVASVFVTSLFQYAVIICLAGAVIRTFFATVDPNLSRYPPAPRFA